MASYKAPSKTKKEKVRKRLFDMRTFEMAAVPHGANQGRFVTMKENKMLNLEKISQAHAAIGKVVTVLKSGAAPSAQVTETLQQSLADANAILSEMSGVLTLPEAFSEKLTKIETSAKDLLAQTRDVFTRDSAEALLKDISNLKAIEITDPADEVEENLGLAGGDLNADAADDSDDTDDADAAVPAKAVEAQAADPAATAAPAADAVAAPADVVAAAPVADVNAQSDADAGVTAADNASAPELLAAPAAPAAPAAAVADVVTKADLQAFSAALAEQLGAAIKGGLAEVTQVFKSNQDSSYSVPPASTANGVASGNDDDDDCYGFYNDLND